MKPDNDNEIPLQAQTTTGPPADPALPATIDRISRSDATRPGILVPSASQMAGEKRQATEDGPSRVRDHLTLAVPLIKRLDNARQYPRRVKNLIISIVAACGMATPLGSNILLPVLAPAASDLNTTKTVINLSIAFYCLAVAITPLWWTSLAVGQGSRSTYVAAFFLFIVFNCLAAVSHSAGMFIAMRLLVGGTSAPVQALGAATVADLCELKERSSGMGKFLLGAMAGNVVGPIIGGALGSRWGWRSTQWFMAIYGAVIWLSVVFLLPETRPRPAGVGTVPSQPDGRSGSIAASVKRRLLSVAAAITKPFKLVPLLRFLPILVTVYYTAVNFAAYYFVIIVIQATFSVPPYSYSAIIVGLLYLPNAAGNVLAAVFGARWTDRVMVRAAAAAGRYDDENRPKPRPHDMLGINIWIAAIMFPAAMLVSGWAAEEHIVALPLVANFFFAFGNMMVQNITTVMLTEFTPSRPADSVALSNLMRNTLGAVACVVAQPLINVIGVGWVSTIVAIICAASAVCIWLLQRNADKWSKQMTERMAQ